MISKEILIVDDEDFIRDLLTDFLSLEGYICQSAANADEALDKLSRAQTTFALILLDRNLENCLAENLIASIQQMQINTPIILLTGDHEVGSDEARRMGACNVVHKPFQIDTLLTYIRETLESQ